MSKIENSNIDIQIIYLISCALNGREASKDDINNIDLILLYKVAKAHAITVIIYNILEKSGAFKDASKDIIELWKTERDTAVYKNILLDQERESILEELEANKIWCIPLKGSVVKKWYPDSSMREMSDNDILYDKSYKLKVKEIFVNRNYTVKYIGDGVHDVYIKPPVYNFEMHSSLFSNDFDYKFFLKYKDVKDMLILDDGKRYRYHFSDEDLYVYITAHSYKHYAKRGTGLRTLIDNYIINHRNIEKLNWNYIESELERLDIKNYERLIREISDRFFAPVSSVSEIQLTENEKSILYNFLKAGVYGNIKIYVDNILKSMEKDDKGRIYNVKLRYIFSRLFPGKNWCQKNYPFFYKHPYFMPLLWTYRLLNGILRNGKQVYKEFCTVIKCKYN